MKGIVFLSLLMALTVSASILPLGTMEPRYVWIPDENGVMNYVDLLDDSLPIVRFEPEEDIVYILHTRKNPTEGQIIKKGDIDSIERSNFDSTKPVKITVHGWVADGTSGSNTKIRDAFLKVMDVNMITVDWGIGANVGYVQAVKNVIAGAKSLGGFIDWLNTLGVSFSDLHLIGHSLGGQFVGIAARSCTKGLVEYVTAMDPAHPSWSSTSQRIRKTDAKYVEVIHTNSGLLGMIDPAGHNDFYVNGGKSMPGCGVDIQCSHTRSTDYMAASIDHKGFMGVQCMTSAEALEGVSNCTGTEKLYLGGSTIKPELGIFALTTNAQPPYHQGGDSY